MPIEDATLRVLPIVIAVLKVGAELNTTVPVIVPPASGSLVASATVILAEPLNDTPLIVLAVVSVSAFGW